MTRRERRPTEGPASTTTRQVDSTQNIGSRPAVDFAALLDTVGFTAGEFVSIGYEDTAGTFHTAVMPAAGAAATIGKLPRTANVFFSVNPTTGPARTNSGRGAETGVTRLAALWCDLDVKPGACGSLDVARAIVANLSIILGTRPSVTVHSGHGLHAYWPISDGHIADGNIAPARSLVRRWGRLVDVVAETLNVAVDNVYDLARMLRVPGSYNNKAANGQAPPLVIAHADTGGPLTMTEIDERLTEVGIDQHDGDAAPNVEEVSPPADWKWAEQTCAYVAQMINNWAGDGPKLGKGRNPWLYNNGIRLACAHRLGCITEADHRQAKNALVQRFTHLVRTTEPIREPKRLEFADAWKYGARKAATKTDEQARAELGGHTHVTDTEATAATDRYDDPGVWTFTDGASFILDIPATIPALWGRDNEILWAEGESLMIAGPMGLGKTTLLGLLIRAQLRTIGDGVVLGLPVTPRTGRILYLAMDRPAQIARALRRQFSEDERDVLRERLVIWKGPPPSDVARNPTLLTRLAEAAGAQTVYLDSIKDAAIGLSDDEVGAGYNRARQHLITNGCQLAEAHHTVKRGSGGGPPTAVADIYGSAWITNGTGSIVLLSGDPGDPIVGFRHIRQPADEVGPYRLLHDQTVGSLTIDHAVDLVEMVRLCGVDGLTAKGAAAAVSERDNPSRSDIEKARRKLDQLAASGVLVRIDGDRGGSKVNQRQTTAWFLAERRYE